MTTVVMQAKAGLEEAKNLGKSRFHVALGGGDVGFPRKRAFDCWALVRYVKSTSDCLAIPSCLSRVALVSYLVHRNKAEDAFLPRTHAVSLLWISVLDVLTNEWIDPTSTVVITSFP